MQQFQWSCVCYSGGDYTAKTDVTTSLDGPQEGSVFACVSMCERERD